MSVRSIPIRRTTRSHAMPIRPVEAHRPVAAALLEAEARPRIRIRDAPRLPNGAAAASVGQVQGDGRVYAGIGCFEVATGRLALLEERWSPSGEGTRPSLPRAADRMSRSMRITLPDHVVRACPPDCFGGVGWIGGSADWGSLRGGANSPVPDASSGPGTKRVTLTFHASRSASVRTDASSVGVATIFPTTEGGAP